MLKDLEEPSLGVLRARLIQEKLAGPGSGGENRALSRLAATGKTGSGKSTLGNLLVGMAGLLRSTGFQDCTDSADVLRFSRGLRYVDLPGVAGSDELENCNRAALGLPQRPELGLVGTVRVREFTPQGPAGERQFPLDRLDAGLPRPDLVLYVVAPHQLLNKDELPYLGDLLAVYGIERIVFVLNTFHRVDGAPEATAQNVEEVADRLDRVCRSAGAALGPERLIALDCRTGEGLDRLLAAVSAASGDDGLLAEVVAAQRLAAPIRYREAVGRAVADYVSQAAALTPGPEGGAAQDLEAAAARLLEFAGRLGAAPPPRGAKRWLGSFRTLAAAASQGLRREATEPVIERRSKQITHTEPVYEWVEETDYNQPLYETRRTRVDAPVADLDDLVTALGRWWHNGKFAAERWESRSVRVGYGTIRRQVATGTREVYDRTEHWDEAVGTRVTSVGYDHYGPVGPALLLIAWAAALRGRAPNSNLGPGSRYDQALHVVAGFDAQRATRPGALADFTRELAPGPADPLWSGAGRRGAAESMTPGPGSVLIRGAASRIRPATPSAGHAENGAP